MCVPVPTADGVYVTVHELLSSGAPVSKVQVPLAGVNAPGPAKTVNVTVPVGSVFVPRDSVSVTVAVQVRS